MTKEELLLLPARAKSIFISGKWEIGDFTQFVKKWNAHRSIEREPAYVAFYVAKKKAIWAIAEVDIGDSNMKEGIIATKGANKVYIQIRFKPRTKAKNTLRSIRYTTFKKLLTHGTTNDL